jgi:shikimate kinase
MNLYFCGIIGSGKTAIGSRLAQRLGFEFCDLDQEMNARLGYSFHRLVQEQGWLAFRELEYSICKYFAAKQRAVVCLGGGTVRYEWNMDVIKGTGPVIYWKASIDTLVERVSRSDRPRVNPGVTIREDITRIRKNSYHKYLRPRILYIELMKNSFRKKWTNSNGSSERTNFSTDFSYAESRQKFRGFHELSTSNITLKRLILLKVG